MRDERCSLNGGRGGGWWADGRTDHGGQCHHVQETKIKKEAVLGQAEILVPLKDPLQPGTVPLHAFRFHNSPPVKVITRASTCECYVAAPRVVLDKQRRSLARSPLILQCRRSLQTNAEKDGKGKEGGSAFPRVTNLLLRSRSNSIVFHVQTTSTMTGEEDRPRLYLAACKHKLLLLISLSDFTILLPPPPSRDVLGAINTDYIVAR